VTDRRSTTSRADGGCGQGTPKLSHPIGTSIHRGTAFPATKISFAVRVQFLLGAPQKLHKIQRPMIRQKDP